MTKTMIWTTVVAALFTTASLKMLHYFNFIKWSPIGWAKKWLLFGSAHEWWKWSVLFIILFIIFGIFYQVAVLTSRIPPSVTALCISAIAAVTIEWLIHAPTSVTEGFKTLSIPFFSILAIVSRFVTGTAVYMKKSFR